MDAASQEWRRPGRVIQAILIGTMLIALVFGPYAIPRLSDHQGVPWSGLVFGSIILGYMFAGVPILVCLTQNANQRRQLRTLALYSGNPVGTTEYFRQAVLRLRAFSPATMSPGFIMPIVVFFLITVVAIITIFLGFTLADFTAPSVVLGGVHVGVLSGGDLEAYQRGTFAVGAAAFFGAYAYVTQRLIERSAVSDLSPMVFYKYSAHILVACSVAGIVRLGFSSGGAGQETYSAAVLTIIGFAIGRFPNQVIGRLSRNVANKLSFLADRPEVAGNSLPSRLSLQLIDDIQPEMIDRLAELQIFSAFDLATCNPILVWMKTPTDLSQIVAWLAQAQLILLVRETGLAKTRALLVSDIFDFVVRLNDPAGSTQLLEVFGLRNVPGAVTVGTIETSDRYANLLELRDALRTPGQPHYAG